MPYYYDYVLSTSMEYYLCLNLQYGILQLTKENYVVTSCVRRQTDSIDKRFCFDISVQDRSVKQPLPAYLWMMHKTITVLSECYSLIHSGYFYSAS